MSEWLISRDMNMTRANVIGNLLHPENWGKKKNPAATPSALADWGFVIGRVPSPLGRTLITGTLSWQEACILSLAKRGPCDGDAPIKPFVAMMKALAVLDGKTRGRLSLTARSFTRLSAIESYEQITESFCLGLNAAEKRNEPPLSNYRDIWLNALAESGLFVRNDDEYELLPSDAVKAFVAQVAKYGDRISPCPSKRSYTNEYYTYMGSVDSGLPEIFDLMSPDVIWNIFPHFQKHSCVQNQRPTRGASVDALYQLITYGAPGTGKSFGTQKETAGHAVYRTTFHPDSDYSTFVGAYKPTMRPEQRVNCIDDKAKSVKDADGNPSMQDVIAYDFVPQAFVKAYVDAWRKWAAAQVEKKGGGGEGDAEKVFLVIEEINRGNCAQIFGDLFQLLDRNEAGYSEYAIDADADLKRHLAQVFGGADGARALPADVASGKKLILPPNLYIRATMNTSDQSLFPIDSAFKRRWEWKYVPIAKPTEAGWKDRVIVADGKAYDWWDFLQKANAQIFETTKSEDKQLGYFFVKASDADGRIKADRFGGKVLFYLYNDVFKDYALPPALFGDGSANSAKYEFKMFFDERGETREDIVAAFLEQLKVPCQPLTAEAAASQAAE